MRRFYLFVFFVYVSAGFGVFGLFAGDARASFDERRLQASMRARTAAEALEAEVDGEELRSLKAACEAELRAKGVPVACYEMLAPEARLAGKAPSLPGWLEDVCELAAKRASTEDLERLSQEKERLPPLSRCRVGVGRRIEELEYILAKKDPAALFRARSL